LNKRFEPEVNELVSSIALDHAAMESAIGFALCIDLDSPLRNHLRTAAGAAEGQPFFVRALNEAWLEIDGKGRVRARRERDEGTPWVDYMGPASQEYWSLSNKVEAAYSRTRALQKARELIAPIADARGLPSREKFAKLSQWSALIEHAAYRCATRISGLLDVARPPILQHANLDGDEELDARLAQYWVTMHAMANMTLLSSEPAAGSWLSDMAAKVPWRTWTPTFSLLRERTLWLAVCAARSAMAFGHKAVEKYMNLLSQATHPIKVFDALYGLSAIALSDPDICKSVLAELRSLRAMLKRRYLEHSVLIEAAFDDAIKTISAPVFDLDGSDWEIRTLGWHAPLEQGLATPGALRADPASINSSGRFLGLVVLPFIVSTPRHNLYPMKSKGRHGLRIADTTILEIVFRAWGVAIVRNPATTLH
jgi:hypothetical protein